MSIPEGQETPKISESIRGIDIKEKTQEELNTLKTYIENTEETAEAPDKIENAAEIKTNILATKGKIEELRGLDDGSGEPEAVILEALKEMAGEDSEGVKLAWLAEVLGVNLESLQNAEGVGDEDETFDKKDLLTEIEPKTDDSDPESMTAEEWLEVRNQAVTNLEALKADLLAKLDIEDCKIKKEHRDNVKQAIEAVFPKLVEEIKDEEKGVLITEEILHNRFDTAIRGTFENSLEGLSFVTPFTGKKAEKELTDSINAFLEKNEFSSRYEAIDKELVTASENSGRTKEQIENIKNGISLDAVDMNNKEIPLAERKERAAKIQELIETIDPHASKERQSKYNDYLQNDGGTYDYETWSSGQKDKESKLTGLIAMFSRLAEAFKLIMGDSTWEEKGEALSEIFNGKNYFLKDAQEQLDALENESKTRATRVEKWNSETYKDLRVDFGEFRDNNKDIFSFLRGEDEKNSLELIDPEEFKQWQLKLQNPGLKGLLEWAHVQENKEQISKNTWDFIVEQADNIEGTVESGFSIKGGDKILQWTETSIKEALPRASVVEKLSKERREELINSFEKAQTEGGFEFPLENVPDNCIGYGGSYWKNIFVELLNLPKEFWNGYRVTEGDSIGLGKVRFANHPMWSMNGINKSTRTFASFSVIDGGKVEVNGSTPLFRDDFQFKNAQEFFRWVRGEINAPEGWDGWKSDKMEKTVEPVGVSETVNTEPNTDETELDTEADNS
ncbi:hypothetical protein K9M41_00870 [Candidatus Gracilibacteria bacterium]|nr:hypothetical protein [Candidatus Gracilibacteria bacterium]